MTTEAVDVNELINNLRISYIAELPHRLDEIESAILSTNNEASFLDNIENLYRHIHSLKGSAGTYGLHIITSICHNFEDDLSLTRGEQQAFQSGIDNWLKYIDLLKTTLHDIETGCANFSHVEAEIAKLRKSQTGQHQHTYHGLIVATTQLYEHICRSTFSDSPIKFSFCQDGHEALGRLLNEPFDLLITDMETASLNGMAMVGALRLTSNRNKNIKTILMTSTPMRNFNRQTDPDYVVKKDGRFVENIISTIKTIMQEYGV